MVASPGISHFVFYYELLSSDGPSASDGIDGQFLDGHCANGDARRQFVQIFLQIFQTENQSADFFCRRLSVIFAAGQQVAILGQEAAQVKRLFPGHLPVCPNMKTVRLQRLVDVGREILDVEQLAWGRRTRSCARKWPAGASFSANWPNASFRDATSRSGAALRWPNCRHRCT